MPQKATIEIPEHWQALFYRYCRPATLVWPLLAAMAFIAWNRGLALLYALCALVLAALALSLVTKWRLRQLQADIKPINPVHAGHSQTIELVVHAKKPIYGCQLTINDGVFESEPLSALAITATPSTLVQHFTPTARGYWTLNKVTAKSAYPFGLLNWHHTLTTEPAAQLVYPALVPIRSLPPSWLSGSEQHAHFAARHKGAGELLLGLRDYQTGDPFRHIDWRASARSNEVKVREFEQLDHPHLCLVLNNHQSLNLGESSANAFEHSLILAASLARFAIEASLGLSAYLPDGQYLTISSHHQLLSLFTALARLTPSQQLPAAVTPKAGCILVTFQTDKAPTNITATRAKHWRVTFDGDSYLKPLSRKKVAPPHVLGDDVIIPVGAHTPLAELFHHG